MQMEKGIEGHRCASLVPHSFLLKCLSDSWKSLATAIGLHLHAREVWSEIGTLDLLAARYFRLSGSLPAVMLVNAAEAL